MSESAHITTVAHVLLALNVHIALTPGPAATLAAALSNFVTGVAVLIVTIWFTGIFTNMPDNLAGKSTRASFCLF